MEKTTTTQSSMKEQRANIPFPHRPGELGSLFGTSTATHLSQLRSVEREALAFFADHKNRGVSWGLDVAWKTSKSRRANRAITDAMLLTSTAVFWRGFSSAHKQACGPLDGNQHDDARGSRSRQVLGSSWSKCEWVGDVFLGSICGELYQGLL